MKAGGNLFTVSPNSGNPAIGTADSGGRGQITTGFLEGSNVDLAQQFTNMIMAERGFQANSRVITTSDEILQDLVNIKH
jgi:flagellar hook protein FlgE